MTKQRSKGVMLTFTAKRSATPGWFDVTIDCTGQRPATTCVEGLEGMLLAARDVGRACATHAIGKTFWFDVRTDDDLWDAAVDHAIDDAFDAEVSARLEDLKPRA